MPSPNVVTTSSTKLAAILALVLLGCGGGDDARGRDGGGPIGDGAASADRPEPQPASDAATASGDGAVADRNDGPTAATCLPRTSVPPPVARTASVASMCTAGAACGGALEGTQWEIASACFDSDAWTATIRSVCSAATLGTAVPARPAGAARFMGGQADVQVSAQLSVLTSFPNACHGCRCADLEARLRSAGLDASCSPQCTGGSCNCFLARTFTTSASGAYAATGTNVDVAGGQAFPFCVADGALTLQDASGSVLTFRPPTALRTPEICDGVDNDGNGIVDDHPIECPSCSNVGACASGVVATCNGASGWTCTYTSPDWEAVESKCDAVDNDCDGEVNEELGCREICDGVDNDGIGGIDDAPTGGPTCTQVGVCAAGDAAMCGGAAGWACAASSPKFEAGETACDALDNDCDGLTDEVCCDASAARLYFAYIDKARTGAFIGRAHLDGTQIENVVQRPLSTLLDVAIDPVGRKIYWANLDTNAVERANLDGSNVEQVVSDVLQPRLAIDVGHRLLFAKAATGIVRLSLDDLTQRTPVPAGVNPLTMTVDTQRGWLYLGDGTTVTRVGFDGSGKESVSDPAAVGQVIEGLAVDPIGKRVYWTSTGGIHSASLDLHDAQRLLTLQYPHHVFVDVAARRLYWSETVKPVIGTMPIGATTPTYLPAEFNSVRFGAVVPCP